MNVLLQGKLDTNRTKPQEVYVDEDGNLKVSLGTTTAGEDTTLDRQLVANAANYTQISTNATTTVKASRGLFFAIEVVTAGAGQTVTVYDNVTNSGTKLLDAAPTDVVRSSYTPGQISGMAGICATGITVVTSGGTPAVINVWWV